MGHHSGRGTTAAAMVHSVLADDDSMVCLERRNILIPTYGTIINASKKNWKYLQYLWLVAS